jgi:uncharacterized membrane protein
VSTLLGSLRDPDMGELYSTSVLGFSVYLILWAFVIYSFLGVVVEMAFCLLMEGVLESRLGLLYLPLRPMYGVGGVACMVLLHRFLQRPILIFLFGMLICTVVEYVAALVMDKAFGTIFWDYGDKPLNLGGRVCLQYSVCWGLLALLPVYAAGRFLPGLVSMFRRQEAVETVLTVVMVLVLLSWILTLCAFARIRERVTILKRQPAGEKVTATATRAWDRLVDWLAPDFVMIRTFPQTNLMTDLTALTGERRTSIRVPGYRALSAVRRSVP